MRVFTIAEPFADERRRADDGLVGGLAEAKVQKDQTNRPAKTETDWKKFGLIQE